MATGTIKKFVDDRGFGFIKPDGAGEEIFFHHSAFAGEPQEGMKVEFDTEKTDRGLNAKNVRAI